MAELRTLAKSSRKESPGPDGVPPYLLAILPDNAFSVLHHCLTLCYEAGEILHGRRVSETLCLFKGKGSWRDPDRWRPIAMSNSVYQLLMRWVYKKLYPLISPQLRPRQFRGNQGVSTAHATQAFLDDIENGTKWQAIFSFDMYHVFDSPPKILIREVLQHMGTPTKLLLLISTVLEHGSTFIRGTPDEIFGTTNGVKQGCLLCCFLFVIVFQIPLRYIHSHNIILSAYVDDISTPVAYNDGPRIASVVQAGLNLIGCQLNVIKSESLSVSPHCPPPPCIAKLLQPPRAPAGLRGLLDARDMLAVARMGGLHTVPHGPGIPPHALRPPDPKTFRCLTHFSTRPPGAADPTCRAQRPALAVPRQNTRCQHFDTPPFALSV